MSLIFSQSIIRESKIIKNEMAHQLYVYQSLIFRLLVDMVNTKGNASNQVSRCNNEKGNQVSLQAQWQSQSLLFLQGLEFVKISLTLYQCI